MIGNKNLLHRFRLNQRVLSDVETWIIETLNCTVLHGSSVQLNNKNLLLLGNSMSGKTSLTYHLYQQCGAKYMDDDCIYILDHEIIGFCFPIAMRMQSGDLSNVIGYTDDGVMNNRALIKMPKCVSSFDRIDFVLFPQYNSCKNEISEITYGELYTRILKNVRHSLSMERLYIDIGQMTKTVRAFEMSYTSSQNAEQQIKDIGIL